MSRPDTRNPGSSAPWQAASAAVLLGVALSISSGLYDPIALMLVSVACLLAIGSTVASRTHEAGAGRQAATVVLAGGLAGSLALGLSRPPGWSGDPSALLVVRPILVAAGAVLLTYGLARVPPWIVRLRFPLVIAAAAAVGSIVILASPAPSIDVWTLRHRGGLALGSGLDPYAVAYPNIYGPGTPFLDPSLLSPDGTAILAYPYMPAVATLDAVAARLGDVRWSSVLAIAVAALLVRTLGRASREAELAGALLVLQPRGWMVVEQAWTEPLVLVAVLLATLSTLRASEADGTQSGPWRAWALPGIAFGIAGATKQYALLLLAPLLLALPRQSRGRVALLAVTVVVATMLPFVVLDRVAFLRGLLEFQIRQPFRVDALSWPAAIVALGGPRLPTWPAFLLVFGFLALVLRGPVTVGRGSLAAATAWTLLVVANKQAFANYYWLSVGLLCAGVAILLPRSGAETR
jgi:hypothetical protein